MNKYFCYQQFLFYKSFLAEPRDGAPNNYFIVEQLQNRLNKRAVSDKDGLEGPHYEDQWWMRGKSYVSLI